MNRGGDVISHINGLIELFSGHLSDRTTLDELRSLIPDRANWRRARLLFNRIRDKTLNAEKKGDETLLCQYAFEEICAKTLYNLTGDSAPYDADSPYWIIPLALILGRQVGIEDKTIIDLVA